MTKVEVPVWPLWGLLLTVAVLTLVLMFESPAPTVIVGSTLGERITDDDETCADRVSRPGETLCLDLLIDFPLTYVICFRVPDDPTLIGRVCGTIGEFRTAVRALYP